MKTEKKTAEAYIEKNDRWKVELTVLREILLACELEEAIKWGIPTYMVNGKNVVGIAAFKDYVALWFHNGVFLKDEEKVLINAQEDKTRGLRQWRFASANEIDRDLISRYTEEAIANQKAGKEIKAKTRKPIVSDELENALNASSELKSSFKTLTPGRQTEYAEYISGAKQESTRLKRLEKCIPLILAGVGLNDKYRK